VCVCVVMERQRTCKMYLRVTCVLKKVWVISGGIRIHNILYYPLTDAWSFNSDQCIYS